jgi:hypothetical protein
MSKAELTRAALEAYMKNYEENTDNNKTKYKKKRKSKKNPLSDQDRAIIEHWKERFNYEFRIHKGLFIPAIQAHLAKLRKQEVSDQEMFEVIDYCANDPWCVSRSREPGGFDIFGVLSPTFINRSRQAKQLKDGPKSLTRQDLQLLKRKFIEKAWENYPDRAGEIQNQIMEARTEDELAEIMLSYDAAQ